MKRSVISLAYFSFTIMLIETIIAIFLLICLACFSSINMHNILIVHKRRDDNVSSYAEVERPSGFMAGTAALGTLIYFLEALVYLFLIFYGSFSVLYAYPSYFKLPFAPYMQILGLILTLSGYSLFIWSVIARNIYAVSWKMPENQKLVTWGPYCYVRHPSYLGYFLMFFGLFFIWPSLFTLLPMAAIPGYYRITFEEEKLLTQRFGEEYLRYQKRTGRFIPRLP
jgi:protein-S-isoprenylcysteine O-methyltransferase Ste14